MVKRFAIYNKYPEDVIRRIVLLLASLVVSLVFGLAVAYVAIETLPCHWFGTGFEGACAQGVLLASSVIGLVGTILLFASLCYRVLRRQDSR